MVLRIAGSVGLMAIGGVLAQEPTETSCVQCHRDPDMMGAERARIVADYEKDVHREAGLACQDCHGGNPDPELALDVAGAMDASFRENPYRGAPKRQDSPEFCGRCHSDAGYMKRYRPGLRVDQLQEYRTSRHGVALAAGDTRVATCIDCHGVHGIRRVDDAESPVFSKNLAGTCAKCHADASRMQGYTLEDGRPIPTDQFALWQRSVHGRAMLEKEDLSAPTCNDCHGNHGAVPPGVQSISFVCGQCHAREADLFRASPKEAGFRQHAEFLEEVEGGDCLTCHELPDSFSRLGPIPALTECTTCHGNHGVSRPTIAMLGPLPDTPCDLCHDSAGARGDAPSPSISDSRLLTSRSSLLEQAKQLGLEGARRFDWLVDQSLQLPQHTVEASSGVAPKPRDEFLELFTKFRIGRTTSLDPNGSDRNRVPAAVRCPECHANSESEGTGARVSAQYMDRFARLSSMTAAAERELLEARRGGVETRPALSEIEKAVESGIQLQVLVHGFSVDPEGPFTKEYDEGMAAASRAVAAGDAALRELRSRRQGLIAALVFIGLTLIGLFFKIRQIGSR